MSSTLSPSSSRGFYRNIHRGLGIRPGGCDSVHHLVHIAMVQGVNASLVSGVALFQSVVAAVTSMAATGPVVSVSVGHYRLGDDLVGCGLGFGVVVTWEERQVETGTDTPLNIWDPKQDTMNHDKGLK